MSNLNIGDFGLNPPAPTLDASDMMHLPKHRRDWLEFWGNQWGGPKVMPGTCERCVWGSGRHSSGCIAVDPYGTCPNCKKEHPNFEGNAYCQKCSAFFSSIGGRGFLDQVTGRLE